MSDGVTPDEDRIDTTPVEEVDEALMDLDPNDAIEVLGDPETDTEDDPANDEGRDDYEPEDVPEALPVDDSMADVVIPSAEDDVVLGEDEED